MDDYFFKQRERIRNMEDALAGGGGGTRVWCVNLLACEGQTVVVSSLAKALAVPVSEESDRLIYGDPDNPNGKPYEVAGGKVGAGDAVFLVAIGDRGCCSAILRVYKDKAAAEEGLARIKADAEEDGWSVWVQECAVDVIAGAE